MAEGKNLGAFGIDITGMAELQRALEVSPELAIAALAGSIWEEANDIITDAKGETPVDKGTMRASGVALEPTIEGTVVEVVFGFGGAAQSYDVMQHERTDFRHRVGKAHFLIDPVNRAVPGMDARVSARMATKNLFPGVI